MDPKESRAATTGEVLPFREPKSCEEPPIPMLPSLIGEGQGHDGSVGTKRKNRISNHSFC